MFSVQGRGCNSKPLLWLWKLFIFAVVTHSVDIKYYSNCKGYIFLDLMLFTLHTSVWWNQLQLVILSEGMLTKKAQVLLLQD